MAAVVEPLEPQLAARIAPGIARRLLASPSALVGGILLLCVLAIALSAGRLFPGDPLDMVAEPFLRPGANAAHLAGTDMLGRDLLAGIFHGARVSLLIATASTAIALLLGVSGGLLAGFYGGCVDAVITRITEFFQTVPAFLFALAIVAVLQPSVAHIALAIALTSWTALARLVRAEVLKLRHSEMVQASIAVAADRKLSHF